MYGDFPAKNTVCTPYIPKNVWFWPTLLISSASCLNGVATESSTGVPSLDWPMYVSLNCNTLDTTRKLFLSTFEPLIYNSQYRPPIDLF